MQARLVTITILMLGALLAPRPAGAGLVIDLPFNDPVYTNGQSVVGRGGAETGFSAANKWASINTVTGTYGSTGLVFSANGKTLVAGGGDLYLSHGGGANVNRQSSVGALPQYSTLFGAFVCQPISFYGNDWTGIGFGASAPAYSASWSMFIAPKGSTSSQSMVGINGNYANCSTAPSWAMGGNYLAIFQITNIGDSGSHTLTQWVLTTNQFAFFEADNTLGAAELNAATIGANATQVFQRVSVTVSGALPLNYFAIGGSGDGTEIFRVAAIRLGTNSLDEVAPIYLPPVITNGAASNITATSATLYGTLVSTGGLPTYAGRCLGTNAATWTTNLLAGGPFATGPVSNMVSGLLPDTTYVYTFFASNSAGTGWAPTTNSFRTEALPAVTNGAADVAGTSVTLWGGVVSTGTAPAEAYCCYWPAGTASSNLLWLGPCANGTVLSTNLMGLGGGIYYYRFMASNQWGLGWAPAAASFTILAEAAPKWDNPLPAVAVQPHQALLQADLLSTNLLPTDVDCYWWVVGSPSTSSVSFGTCGTGWVQTNVTGLAALTSYGYAFRATNALGADWVSGTFSTPSAVPVIAITPPGTYGVTAISANLLGSLTATGVDAAAVFCLYGLSNSLPSFAFTNPVPYVTLGAVTSAVSGLQMGTDYAFTFLATNSEGAGWAPTTNYFTTPAPAVNNAGASNVVPNAATLWGVVASTAGLPTTVYCYWGTTAGPWDHAANLGLSGVGSVSNALAGLDMGVTYYFRYQVSNLAGTVWAPSVGSFTTVSGIRLTNSCNLSSGANLVGTNLYGTGSITVVKSAGNGTAGTPWLYAVPGLDCGAFKLQTTNGDSLVLNLYGSNLVGNSSATNLSTFLAAGLVQMGSLCISNVAAITCGRIDLHNGNTTWGSGGLNYNAGSLRIGGPLAPAGNITVNGIDTWVGDGRIVGSVTIYSSGDVRIGHTNGSLAAIDTHLGVAEGSWRAGAVSIYHRGAFAAREIGAYSSVWQNQWPGGGDVTLQGSVGGAAAGACTVSNILTYVDTNGYGNAAGNITIAGYTGVTVSNLWSFNNTPTLTPGNIAITNIAGAIAIVGTINANVSSGVNDGTLVLQTAAGSGGDIRVGNLDLSLVRYASFGPDGAGYITGTLLGTNGVAAVPGMVTNALRVPAGKRIWYAAKLNPGLGQNRYTVASLTGTPGAGGLLCPYPIAGTAVFLR